MEGSRDPSGGNRRTSKIPKRTPSRRVSPLSQSGLDSSSSRSADSTKNKSNPRIFDDNNLNSACDFLSQLKTKLQNDVDGCAGQESQRKVSDILNTFLESDKSSDQKVSGIVSSILDTLKDLSENFTPTASLESQTGADSHLTDVNKMETVKCLHVARKFTVGRLQFETTGGNRDEKNGKTDQEKLIKDKELLHQLTELHGLLKDTISKLIDKGTFTQEDGMKLFEFRTCVGCAKANNNEQLFAEEPQVEVGHETKPTATNDTLEMPQVKRLLEILQSPEVRPLLNVDEHVEGDGVTETPPNTEITKTASDSTKNETKHNNSFTFSSIEDFVPFYEQSDDGFFPIGYKVCVCKQDTTPSFSIDTKPDPDPPPILPPPVPFSEIEPGKKESSKDFESSKHSPSRSPIKVSPRSSPIEEQEREKPPKPEEKISKTLDLVVDKKMDTKRQKGKEKEKKAIQSKKPEKRETKKSDCTSSCAPFKSLERSLKQSLTKSLDAALDKDPGKKSSVKGKFSFSRKKQPESPAKKQKEKQEKRQKSDDEGKKIEEPPKTPAVTPQIVAPNFTSSLTTVTSVVPLNQDVTIPPPPTFDYDSYDGVVPAKEDSTLALLKLYNESDQIKTTGELITSTEMKKNALVYGNEKSRLVNVFQVSSNPAVRSTDKLKPSSVTTGETTTLREDFRDILSIPKGNSGLLPVQSQIGEKVAQVLPLIEDVNIKRPANDTSSSEMGESIKLEVLASPLIHTAVQGTGSQILKNSVSTQDHSGESTLVHHSSGSSRTLIKDIDRSTSNNVIQFCYSVQVVPSVGDAQVTQESVSTSTAGKSFGDALVSRSVSVVLPKTNTKVTETFPPPKPFNTTCTGMSAVPLLADANVGQGPKKSELTASLEGRRVLPQLSDPKVAKLRCRNCMCVIGGPPIENEKSHKAADVGDVDTLEELEFLDKNSPQRYFEQVIKEIDTMKKCIEFAMDHQLSVHDKIKAYLDNGNVVKSKYPHFHTVIDGVPVILLWNDDPAKLCKNFEKRRSKENSPWRKSKISLGRKGVQRKSQGKGSSPEKTDPKSGSEKKTTHKSKVLLDHLADAVNKYKNKRKRPHRCEECGSKCHGKYNKVTNTCETTSTSSMRGKSSSPTDHEKQAALGCKCDEDEDEDDDVRHFSRSRRVPRTKSLPKLKGCKLRKFGTMSSTDEEGCDNKPRQSNLSYGRRRTKEKNKSTNLPSKTDTKSIQTYYLTARVPSIPKPPSSSVNASADSESDNDMPYLIDVHSLPQFEHPETVCSSKLFDVKQMDCELRDEIKTGNKQVKDTLLRINLNALLDSFRPAKCCKKIVINGRMRSTYPYPASLQSLPLSEEDLDRILDIIQSNDQKRFVTVTKRLYDETEFNFQTATEQGRPHGGQRQAVYFFELFRKAESKAASAATSASSASGRTVLPRAAAKRDLKIFEFIRRIYTTRPVDDKRVPKRKRDSTKTLYRHRSTHGRHGKKKHRSRKPKPTQRTTSTSMVPVRIASADGKPRRNISFLLIPRSELNNYFCGEPSSMYSPSLNSLPFDDTDDQVTTSSRRRLFDDETDFAKTLGAIYELDENDKDYVVRGAPKEAPSSVSAYSIHSLMPVDRIETNFDVMACRLSAPTNDFSKEVLEELKTSTDYETTSTNSTSLSYTQSPEIPLRRKSIDSELSMRKRNIFSSSSILSDRNSSRIPISCLPLSCSISKHSKSNFLHLPNILTDTKRFLYRQKEEVFKPNLDKIVEKSSETHTAAFASSRRRRKSLKRSRCSVSLQAASSRRERHTSTANGLGLKDEFKAVSANKSDTNKEFFSHELPFALELTAQNEVKTKRIMKIDKAVVAYAISPSSEFTFLGGDGIRPRDYQGRFKSENICVWPVFQSRKTKKKNSAFVVAIHSSAVRLGTKEPYELGDQKNIHGDYCEICRKKNKLSTDSFILGYIGEDLKSTMESKPDPQPQYHSSKKDKKGKYEEKEKVERTEKAEKEEKKQTFEREKKDRPEKAFKSNKGSSRKESSSGLKTANKVTVKKGSKKIIPEVIDIKVPTNLKSTRLKHKFCNGGDRPGYVTVLSTPCNCPDVTIFIPCYCSQCDCNKANKHCRHKGVESDYAMVPIIERPESE